MTFYVNCCIINMFNNISKEKNHGHQSRRPCAVVQRQERTPRRALHSFQEDRHLPRPHFRLRQQALHGGHVRALWRRHGLPEGVRTPYGTLPRDRGPLRARACDGGLAKRPDFSKKGHLLIRCSFFIFSFLLQIYHTYKVLQQVLILLHISYHQLQLFLMPVSYLLPCPIQMPLLTFLVL